MKAVVLKTFKDRHTGELHKKGSTITVSEERFKEILTVGSFVEAIPDSPKKTTKKKEKKNGQ